ncbi:hypothetical protein QYE76_065958 [Lolium multiflorum]|uniref:Transposase (putative) gypsy type domain-containing protein n=1 Tax=Lolium multiflorum TaxID=4521 RepID=A0AAD8W9C9_LOLMU|nr:hypothetical protein QYE76_065958 [Lolium multiflorum]
MFVAFLFRGLSLPSHEFLRSLLFFYGIQLWQLTPNSILHLSIFITVCEAFLDIDPHWGLWRKIFYVKRHNDSNGPPVVGGVGFVVRKEVDYFDYRMKESVQGWRNKWFYLRDTPVSGRRSNLPPFEDVLVAQPKKFWRNALSPEERVIADKLFDQVVDLKNTGGLTISADLSTDELRDEVRRLTCLSMKDNIVLTSARSPYDLKHLPAEASTVAQCYPPTPESGVEPEDDDDDSEETEDAQHILEDSDVQEDDTLTRSRRCFFAVEDDLDLYDDDDDVPLAKRAKLFSGKSESAKESNPSPAKPTPPSMTTVEKVPVSKVIPSGSAPDPSAARDHPIYATVDAVVDFVEQFTRLESENSHLRKTIKTSADQVLEANRLAADAKDENISLKDEQKKLKLLIYLLLGAADITINRARKLQEDSMSDVLSLAAESNVQVLGLLQRTKGALSRLFSVIFPKMKQDKTLGKMEDAFLVDPSEPVEVLKRRSRLFGAVLTFQLLMGHGLGSELEKLSKALPVDDNIRLINLEPFKQSAVTCANQLLKLVDEAKTKAAPEAAPGSSSALP